jgi:hypothetical protein
MTALETITVAVSGTDEEDPLSPVHLRRLALFGGAGRNAVPVQSRSVFAPAVRSDYPAARSLIASGGASSFVFPRKY